MVFEHLLAPIMVGLVIAGVSTLFGLIHPVLRWRRSLMKNIQLRNGLPFGSERDEWSNRINSRAARIRAYENSPTDRLVLLTSLWVIIPSGLTIGWIYSVLQWTNGLTYKIWELGWEPWQLWTCGICWVLLAIAGLTAAWAVSPNRHGTTE